MVPAAAVMAVAADLAAAAWVAVVEAASVAVAAADSGPVEEWEAVAVSVGEVISQRQSIVNLMCLPNITNSLNFSFFIARIYL